MEQLIRKHVFAEEVFSFKRSYVRMATATGTAGLWDFCAPRLSFATSFPNRHFLAVLKILFMNLPTSSSTIQLNQPPKNPTFLKPSPPTEPTRSRRGTRGWCANGAPGQLSHSCHGTPTQRGHRDGQCCWGWVSGCKDAIPVGQKMFAGWWFQIFFIFTPTWRNDPIWQLYIFKMGWNHQLVCESWVFIFGDSSTPWIFFAIFWSWKMQPEMQRNHDLPKSSIFGYLFVGILADFQMMLYLGILKKFVGQW